jgi:protein-disulfide isomerase
MRTVLATSLALLLASCGSSTGTDGTATLRVPVGDSPVDGPADAWVTVVEFSDFQCPFCVRVQPTLAEVLPGYGPDVRHVFKHFPLSQHARAIPTAVAAECARAQGRFWEFHDLVFAAAKAGTLFDGGFDADLEAFATQVGVDVAAWQACRASPAAMEARVESDAALGRQFGIDGTPSFVVNGTLVVGAQPAEAFRAAIDAALARARASGVPAAQYYDRVVLGK